MTIHGVDKAVTDDVFDGGGQRIEKRRQLALLGFAKRSEYVTNHPLAVVSAISTALLHFQPPKIEVDVVMNDDDLRRL